MPSRGKMLVRFVAQAHSLKETHDMKIHNKQREFYCGIDLHEAATPADFFAQKRRSDTTAR